MRERLYNPATEPKRLHNYDPIRCRRVNHAVAEG